MRLIKDRRVWDTSTSTMFFDEDYPKFRPIPVVGRLYETSNKSLFMTVAIEKNDETIIEKFFTNDVHEMCDFLDDVNAPAEMYEKLGITLESA